MSEVPLEKMLDKTDNSVYKLAVIAARRALEIAEGQPNLVGLAPGLKPSVIALNEIAAGKVSLKQK